MEIDVDRLGSMTVLVVMKEGEVPKVEREQDEVQGPVIGRQRDYIMTGVAG